jgi:hippurate hydrolase
VRSYKDEVRKHLLEAIERIAKAEAAAAMAPKPPDVRVTDGTPATYNDPALTKRIAGALQRGLGAANVSEGLPVMAGEDFSEYGRAGVPATVLWVGAVEPKKLEAAKAGGPPLPSLHSSEFAPDREPTIRTGVKTVTLAAMELLAKP